MDEKKKKSYKPTVYLFIIGILLIVCGYLYTTGYFDYYKSLLGQKTTTTNTTTKTNKTTTNTTTASTNTLLNDETVKKLYSYVTETKNDEGTYTLLKASTSLTTIDSNTVHALAYRLIADDSIKYSAETCKVNITKADYTTAITTIFGSSYTIDNNGMYNFYISTTKLQDCGNYLSIHYNSEKNMYIGTITKKDASTTFVLSSMTDAKKTTTNTSNTTNSSTSNTTNNNTTESNTTNSTKSNENGLTITESYVVVKYTYDTTKKTYTYSVYKSFDATSPIDTKKDVTSIDNLSFDTYKTKASKVTYTFTTTDSKTYTFLNSSKGE